MEKAEWYLNNMINGHGHFYRASSIKDSYKMAIEKAQKDAWNEAVRECSENAIAKEDPNDYGTGEIFVDEQSILKLLKD